MKLSNVDFAMNVYCANMIMANAPKSIGSELRENFITSLCSIHRDTIDIPDESKELELYLSTLYTCENNPGPKWNEGAIYGALKMMPVLKKGRNNETNRC